MQDRERLMDDDTVENFFIVLGCTIIGAFVLAITALFAILIFKCAYLVVTESVEDSSSKGSRIEQIQ